MTTATVSARGFTIVRRFAAPREAVFQAWTDPEHLEWFFETDASDGSSAVDLDLRVGGTWRVQMVESEDHSYATGGIYREISPPERLVFAWGATDGWPKIDPDKPEDGPVVTVTLDEVDGTTEMTLEVAFPEHLTEEAVEGWLAVGVIDGWTQTVDRLGSRFPMKYEV